MKKLQSLIFKWNFVFTFMLFFFVLLGLMLLVAKTLVDMTGESRVDLLKQVAERSKIINKAAITLANSVYLNLTSELMETGPDNQDLTDKINQLVVDCNYYFDGLDIDLSALVLMRSGFQYYSKNEMTNDIRDIKNNYWYMDNFYNSKNEFWIMRFGDTLNKTNCMLSYGRIIRNAKGEYMGVILINSMERSFYKVYSDIIDKGNNVYILDQDGYAISHSNRDLIGAQIFYMPAFLEQYGQNGYRLNYEKQQLVSNYCDSTTKWTFVQESDFQNVFGDYLRILSILLPSLLLFLLTGFVLSLLISRYISKPLHLFAAKLQRLSAASFERIEIQYAFHEVHTISLVYNEMVAQIENLIHKIKEDEEIKRKHELNFLQLQINPHFMHNTLFSIKCLVELGQNRRATEMLTSFMHMLRQPIAVKNEFITVRQEVENLQSYTSLMSCRYENVRLEPYVEEETEDCLIPRLLLQPIVENSIFHGLDEETTDYIIELYIFSNNENLVIKIRDRGVGMTREELAGIWTCERNPDLAFNNIGLKNVRDRIKKIYGEEYGLTILSTKGEGTEVEIVIKKQYDGGGQ